MRLEVGWGREEGFCRNKADEDNKNELCSLSREKRVDDIRIESN